ncbi:MAG: hypothetical protein ACI8TP_004511 [Acidimicrobiales bacterium]
MCHGGESVFRGFCCDSCADITAGISIDGQSVFGTARLGGIRLRNVDSQANRLYLVDHKGWFTIYFEFGTFESDPTVVAWPSMPSAHCGHE